MIGVSMASNVKANVYQFNFNSIDGNEINLNDFKGKPILIVNKDLEDNPSLLNSAPETDGWIFKLTDINPEDLHNLMDLSSYETFLETLK